MHSDLTLDILDQRTTDLGNHFRQFKAPACAAYHTQELDREVDAQSRRQAREAAKRSDTDKDRSGKTPTNRPVLTVQTSATKKTSKAEHHASGSYLLLLLRQALTHFSPLEAMHRCPKQAPLWSPAHNRLLAHPRAPCMPNESSPSLSPDLPFFVINPGLLYQSHRSWMTIESSLYPTSLRRPTCEPILSSSAKGSGETPSSVTETITIPSPAKTDRLKYKHPIPPALLNDDAVTPKAPAESADEQPICVY
ncbi:hypothetical protein EV702DRAFT_1207465 [Suillus placidus]|uniref:Uncharacterized protein n=1 Tax=Suillus placidus TaxID=48579 RepID=A0A9P6ZFL8_9AGAM|nr:hypothetical protein EV702DRAFT_1207465 [Suillus placidus]